MENLSPLNLAQQISLSLSLLSRGLLPFQRAHPVSRPNALSSFPSPVAQCAITAQHRADAPRLLIARSR